MNEKIQITWTTIWGETKTHEADTMEDAKEWIRKRRLREDIDQGSWEIH